MKFLFIMIFIFGCSESNDSMEQVKFNLKDFKFDNQFLNYKNKRFSGILKKRNGGINKFISYKLGLKDGVEMHYYQNGSVSKKLNNTNGKKTGIHRAYFQSGNRKYEFHFTDGEHHGDFIRWYDSGQVSTYTLYNMGKVKGHKVWRRNGRIYSNYIYEDGVKKGLNGGKLCLTTKDRNTISKKVTNE